MSPNPKYRSLRGMSDILPQEAALVKAVEDAAREVFSSFCYGEIITPHMEQAELFTRSIGEQTDIVEKEMYAFTDRGGAQVALRPEGTASIVRAFIQNIWKNTPDIYKLFYSGAMFRGERPQKGRKREFYQIGAEVIGGNSPMIDAELIFTLDTILRRLGIEDHRLILNSLGCAKDQSSYKKELSEFLASRKEGLCENCKRRSKNNVLRVLDCKSRICRKVLNDAPGIDQTLCVSCQDHHEKVKELLFSLGVSYSQKTRLVRGLDYYTGTVFEVEHDKLGAQNAVAAGGRYDKLSLGMGGPDVGACGYALGLERLLLLIERRDLVRDEPGILVLPKTGELSDKAFKVASVLWKAGLKCKMDYSGRSFKGQMRLANRESLKYVIIVGDEYLTSGKVVVKNMFEGAQEEIDIEEFSARMKSEKPLKTYKGKK